MDRPLVSVICLCYNQAPFVEEAIHSVFAQSYPNVQLVVVDDASKDGSVHKIKKLKEKYSFQFLPLPLNVGNCKAFNEGLKSAQGEFIIDLAADDVLLPHRVLSGVNALQKAGGNFGVNFSDAYWISEQGNILYKHSDRFPHATVPQGNIYKDLIARFFICSPTMIYRRNVIDYLGGYDESLSYEDFDFWIRSSRRFLYCYTPEALVNKRILKRSMSEKQFSILSPQLKTTFKVCEKIMALNVSAAEQKALSYRIIY